jgi:hypothetical protein
MPNIPEHVPFACSTGSCSTTRWIAHANTSGGDYLGLTRQLTITRPHIPLHAPPLTVPWIVQ